MRYTIDSVSHDLSSASCAPVTLLSEIPSSSRRQMPTISSILKIRTLRVGMFVVYTLTQLVHSRAIVHTHLSCQHPLTQTHKSGFLARLPAGLPIRR